MCGLDKFQNSLSLIIKIDDFFASFDGVLFVGNYQVFASKKMQHIIYYSYFLFC